MDPHWDDRYPDRLTLREEVKHMTEVLARVLLSVIPEQGIEAIYFKGSAQKRWDSPLDYVPELSDLDIHVLFSNEKLIGRCLGEVRQAVDVVTKVENIYLEERPSHIHFPRPQLIVLNRLLREDGYIPSPESGVSVLHGKSYPEADYSDQKRIRRLDAHRLMEEEKFLEELPLRLVDKPSRYLWSALRLLVWHVSPAAPRVLNISGLNSERAWSINRTEAVALLRECGEERMAEDYSRFYLSGWQYFLSGYSDSNAARTSLVSGTDALARAVDVARSWFADQGAGRRQDADDRVTGCTPE